MAPLPVFLCTPTVTLHYNIHLDTILQEHSRLLLAQKHPSIRLQNYMQLVSL